VCCQVVCLLRADHSTRGILPSVVCQVSVIVQPRKGKPWPGIGSKRQRIKKKRVTYWLCVVESGETAKQLLSESRNRQILWQSALHCRFYKSPQLVHIVATCIKSTHFHHIFLYPLSAVMDNTEELGIDSWQGRMFLSSLLVCDPPSLPSGT